MKTIFTSLVICFSFLLSAQEKGASPIQSAVGSPQSAVTRAVVVGISDYQNNEIPDLHFAHRDAEAFAQYLRSDAGGNLDEDHLKLLTNKQATTAQFAAALDWLIDESKKGDKVIIYFSGHGDVERKTRTQLGFLLTWDSPPKMYVAGAFPIFYLQEVVSTLSLDNKAKVVIITDACRSGKLAGGGVNGSQLTNANLSQQFANEIKIMSCQPNEYSIEGEQWGGGRGAFSYHLMDGLYGMADRNTDAKVTLSEIDRYLEDHVTPEVAPISQVPMTVGLKTEHLADVDAAVLQKIKMGKTRQINTMAVVETRGIEDEVLAITDSLTREKYYAWKKAMAEKEFFEPEGTCADDLYNILSKEPSLARLHNHMKRNYAAALQDDVQQVVNQYLYASHREFTGDRNVRMSRYRRIVKQLEKAIEILGQDHYMYSSLTGRKIWVESMIFGWESGKWGKNIRYNPEDSVFIYKQRNMLLKSLEFEPDAAYVLSNLGGNYMYNHRNEEEFQKGIECYYKAVQIAPTWGQPFQNISNIYERSNQHDKALEYINKALATEPDGPFVLYEWGSFYLRSGKIDTAAWALHKAISIDSTYASALYNYANCIYLLGKRSQADSLFQQLVALDSSSHIDMNSVGWFYKNHGEYERAEHYLKLCIDLKKDLYHPYANLAVLYLSFDQPEKTIGILKEGLVQNPNQQMLTEMDVVMSYFSHSQQEAKIKFEEAAKLNPAFLKVWEYFEQIHQEEFAKAVLTWKEFDGELQTWYIVHTYLGALVQNGDMDKAIDLLNQSQPYSLNYQLVTTYQLLEPLRKDQAYQDYLLRHFPEKTKH